MNDDACFLSHSQLLFEVLDLLEFIGVVLSLRAVGNVDVVSDETAGRSMGDTGKVIERIVLDRLLFLFQKVFLMLDLDNPLKGLLEPCFSIHFLDDCFGFHDHFSL